MSRIGTLFERYVSKPLAQADQTHREIVFASLFLLLLMAVGTAGYALIEGWYWMDGFYMTFITITTIGFGEIRELSLLGRLFTIFIAFFGIGSGAFIATRIAQLLLTTQRLHERHLQRIIARMDQHFILCGYGRIGQRIAQSLHHHNKPYVVIDHDPEVTAELKENDVPYIEGEAEDEETLHEAGIDRARGLILTLPEDSANVFITLSARELNADLFILARTNHYRNHRKLIHAGADKVIAPDEVGADRMAQVIIRPNVDSFMEQVLRTGALGLQMEEVKVEEGALLAGKTLAESNFRQRFDAIVIGIMDGENNEMKFNPSPHDRIKAGDVLIVLGNQDMIKRLVERGSSS